MAKRKAKRASRPATRSSSSSEKDCRNHGWWMLVLGVLVLANLYWTKLDWALFIGGLLVLKGLAKLAWY